MPLAGSKTWRERSLSKGARKGGQSPCMSRAGRICAKVVATPSLTQGRRVSPVMPPVVLPGFIPGTPASLVPGGIARSLPLIPFPVMRATLVKTSMVYRRHETVCRVEISDVVLVILGISPSTDSRKVTSLSGDTRTSHKFGVSSLWRPLSASISCLCPRSLGPQALRRPLVMCGEVEVVKLWSSS